MCFSIKIVLYLYQHMLKLYWKQETLEVYWVSETAKTQSPKYRQLVPTHRHGLLYYRGEALGGA